MDVTLPADLTKQVEQELLPANIGAATSSSNRRFGISSMHASGAGNGSMRCGESAKLSIKRASMSDS